jgi:LysM repeat protein
MPDPISPDFKRFDDDIGTRHANNPAQLAEDFSGKIEAAKADGANASGDTTWVVVEKGDNLWDIAEQYGVDPQTLIGDNKQFGDPDLIHPGQVVVVRKPNNIQTPAAPNAGSNQPAAGNGGNQPVANGGNQPGGTTAQPAFGPSVPPGPVFGPSVSQANDPLAPIRADGESCPRTDIKKPYIA